MKYLKILCIVLIVVNLVMSAWYVLHSDLFFHTDIARDFLLLQEIDQKKIVFIGPRSSTQGLFHGPLWLYLNYPAYVIGHGNPVVVGWYWIFLIAVFLCTSFIFAKKLFDEKTAYLYTLFLSVQLIFEARALFNPHGALFLLPAFIFCFVHYLQTNKLKFLIAFIFIAGCIIQFQMAIGIPFLLMATIPIVYTTFSKHTVKHLLAYFFLLIPISTFIIFDVRHNFIQLHSALKYVFSNNIDKHTYPSYFSIVIDRIHLLTGAGFGVFRDGVGWTNQVAFILVAGFVFLQIKQHKHKLIYSSCIYFYLGYYVLSLVNKSGGMLYHYYMPLFPLVFLVFASLITSKYAKAFFVLFIIIYAINLHSAITYTLAANSFFGKDQDSWKFLSAMAQKVYQGPEKSFGYFVYAPDVFAYQPKYAMVYASQHSTKQSYSFQKEPVTYLVIAPPPGNKPGMKDSWWTKNQVHITNTPESVQIYPNGFKIEKYLLSKDQIKVPFDHSIDTGIHFR